MVDPCVERDALREVFWEQLSPALRSQLDELCELQLWELAERWGFADSANVSRYIKGPLRRRLEKEAGPWLGLLREVCFGPN